MRGKLSALLLACIILVPPAQCGGQQQASPAAATQEATRHVEQGDTFFAQRLYDEAFDEYSAAIALDSRLSGAYWGRGRVYHFDRGIYSRAIDDYSKVIELDPKHSRAYYYRGMANAANVVYDRAISDLTRTIEFEPGLSMAYNIRAWCYVNKAQWEQGSQLDLYQLLASYPALAEAYKGAGWLYLKQMQWWLAAIPELFKSADAAAVKADNSGLQSNAAAAEAAKTRPTIIPYVNITPLSGPVGTKLFIYGWGFRGNEDGMTITWDGKIIVCNIRAEVDGCLIVDGSKIPYIGSAYTGDTRETVYVPASTRGRHIIGVYGSSFTPRGTVNDTAFEVTPEIKLTAEPDLKNARVTIAGTGFASGESVAIGLDKAATNTSATADSNGSFKAMLTVPAIKGKEYNLAASGNKGSSAQASLTIPPGKSAPADQADAAEAYTNRGFAHFKKAQWALALADLDKAYTKDPSLNRGAWNKDWALGKQKLWDSAIKDYDKAIAMVTGSPAPQDKPGSEQMKEELALAIANYSKAAELSRDTSLSQKAKESIKFIEDWSKGLDK
jgi:tetratricopeptide (TPR) repeat protein